MALLCWCQFGLVVVNMSLLRPNRRPRGTRITTTILTVAFVAMAAWVYLQRQPQIDYVGQAFAVDGDSLRIGQDRIRLLGLDAPEYEQECESREGEPYPCGLDARDALARLVGDRELTCEASERDQYGRALAVCSAGDEDIGAALVEQGMAVADGRYLAEESAARAGGVGVWQGEFIHPAEWRRGARSDGQENDPLSGILDGLFH